MKRLVGLFFILSLLLVGRALATVPTFDAVGGATSGGDTDTLTTLITTVGPNTTVLGYVSVFGASTTVTSANVDGSAMTKIGTTITSGNVQLQVWSVSGISAGAHTATFFMDSANGSKAAELVSYSGVTAVNNFQSATGTSLSPGLTNGSNIDAITSAGFGMTGACTNTFVSMQGSAVDRRHTSCTGELDDASRSGATGWVYSGTSGEWSMIGVDLVGTTSATATPTSTPTITNTPNPTATPAPAVPVFNNVINNFAVSPDCAGSGITLILNVTDASNGAIIVAGGNRNGTTGTVSSVTVDGNSIISNVIVDRSNDAADRASVYYVLNGTTGNHTVNMKWAPGTGVCIALAASYINVNQSTPFHNLQQADSGGTATHSFTNGTTANNLGIFFDMLAANSAAGSTGVDGSTSRVVNTGYWFGDKASGSGTIGDVWTDTPSGSYVTFELEPSAGPPATATPTPTFTPAATLTPTATPAVTATPTPMAVRKRLTWINQ